MRNNLFSSKSLDPRKKGGIHYSMFSGAIEKLTTVAYDSEAEGKQYFEINSRSRKLLYRFGACNHIYFERERKDNRLTS
jgi:hypothetical protein